MAGDNRSLIDFGYYREGLQRFEYVIVGVSLALCGYVAQTLHPEKLTFLSAYTMEVVLARAAYSFCRRRLKAY